MTKIFATKFNTLQCLRRAALPLGPLRPVFRRPVKELRVDANRALLVGLPVVVDDLLVDADNVLTFVIVN